jgi:predicted Zn-dependent protease
MKEALRYAELAIKEEDKLGVPSGPPDDFKPANELYGELLLKAGRRKEALEQFRASLLRTPNRALSLAGAERSQRLSQ